MKTVVTARELRSGLAPYRDAGNAIGLVPTMGVLHRGHTALVEAARRASDVVVMSVFVNPTQFDDPNDLSRYPRQLDADAATAQDAGVDILFTPDVSTIYPDGHATRVRVGGPAEGFEGAQRPGHFEGVATVCVALFSLVGARMAFFGQKDAQQVAVIKQVVRDLHLDVRIVVVPTVRDPDGLALSSRNARLSADERAAALAIPRALEAGVAAHRRGADAGGAAREVLAQSALVVEYADIARFDATPTLVIAARSGGTRLIDNVPLDDPDRAGDLR